MHLRSKLKRLAVLTVPVVIVIFSLIALAIYLEKYNPHLKKQIQYGPYNQKGSNSLDLYLPDKPVGKLPLIIWIHGGGWVAGDKYPCPSGALLKEGFAVASVNYRLSHEAIFPAQIEDCKTALAYLRKNAATYNLDPNRIGVWGASAGGLLASLIGTTGDAKEPEWAHFDDVSTRVGAVCDWCGPSDLLTIKQQSGLGIVMDHSNPTGPVSRFLGGTVLQRKQLAREASPVFYVRPNCPPFLIMHGDQDDLVPAEQSQELDDALRKAGVSASLVIVEKGGHDFYSAKAMKQVVEFFKKYLAS